MTRAVVLLAALFLAARAAAAEDDCLAYEPAVVELRGKLVTDGDEGAALLPDHPICIHGTAGNGLNATVGGVKRIRLVLVDGRRPADRLLGNHVVARGSLFGSRDGILLVAEKVVAMP